jgi:hypothetical protein
MTIGIYKLDFYVDNGVYIGQSTNIEKRYKQHVTMLLNGKASKKMMDAFIQAKNVLPEVEILLECSVSELDSAENEAIELYNSVECGLNTFHKSRGKYVGLCGDKNGRAKYYNSAIEDVFFYLISDKKITYKEISECTGVSRGMVTDIACLHGHIWLKDKYPQEYTYLESLVGNRASRRYYPLISPNGEEVSVTKLTDFCNIHNLDTGNCSRLLRGIIPSYKGWVCKKD